MTDRIRADRLCSPYIGLFNSPRARTRTRTRKIELVELIAKQIEDEHEYEDEDDKSCIKSNLMAPTGYIKRTTLKTWSKVRII